MAKPGQRKLSLTDLNPQVQEAVLNYYTTRGAAWNSILNYCNGDRLDLDRECRYPQPGEMNAQWFRDMYDRNPIAKRVVQVLPYECWQGNPEVVEDDDPENETPFEQAWDELGKSLTPGGQKSYFKEQRIHPVWEYLKRLDVLQGIGQFGVMLLGVADGKNLQDPADGVEVVKDYPVNDVAGRPVTNSAGERATSKQKFLVFNRQEDWSVKSELEQTLYEQDLSQGILFNATSEEFAKKFPEGKFPDAASSGGRMGGAAQQHAPRPFAGTKLNPTEPGTQAQSSSGWTPNQSTQQAGSGVPQPPPAKPTPLGERISAPPGSAPADGSYILGTDSQYGSAPGLGMPWPAGASLSGTDQQYFGIQFGPSEEMSPIPPERPPQKLIFLRVFDESLVQVVRYEWNITNPRFGLPVMYRITLNDPRQQASGIGLPLATVYVHWSRVIHSADNLHSSEIFGIPRLYTPARILLNLERIYGADGIGFWRMGVPGMAVSTHPTLGGDVDMNEDQVDQMVRDYQDGSRKGMVLRGLQAQILSPALTDPTPHVQVQLQAIAIMIGIPLRVLMGSEQGELASSQDADNWADRKQERKMNYMTPRLCVPTIDRFIYLGILPTPQESYGIKWPEPDTLGAKDKAAIALQEAQALAQYVSGSIENMGITPIAFLTEILGWDDERARRVIEAGQAELEQQMQEQMAQAQEMGYEPVPPEGFHDPEMTDRLLDQGDKAAENPAPVGGSPIGAKPTPPSQPGGNGQPPGGGIPPGKGQPPGGGKPFGGSPVGGGKPPYPDGAAKKSPIGKIRPVS